MSGPRTSQELPAPLAAALEQTARLLDQLQGHPDPAVAEEVAALLQAVDQVHRQALRRLANLLTPVERERLGADAAVRLLFELYDLSAEGERARVAAVLESARPLLGSLGEGIQLVEVDRGVVRVRLGPGSSGAEAQVCELLETTLRRGLPEFERLEVAGAEAAGPALASSPGRLHAGGAQRVGLNSDAGPAGGPVDPLAGLGSELPLLPTPGRAAGSVAPTLPPGGFGRGPVAFLRWTEVARRDELPPDGFLVRSAGLERVLLAQIDGELRAYRTTCGGSPLPLDAARRNGTLLVCPWHGCQYDLRSGQRTDQPDAAPLGSIPLRAVGERLLVYVRERGGSR